MAVLLAVLFVILLITFPQLGAWYEYGDYAETYNPAAGALKVAPLIWLVVFLLWANMLQRWVIARRAEKRRLEAELERARSQRSRRERRGEKRQQDDEDPSSDEEEESSSTRSPPQADLLQQLRTQWKLFRLRKASANYARVQEELRVEKLLEKTVCAVRGRSGRFYALCKEGKKFVLVDPKRGRIVAELLGKNAEEAKREALGY